MDPAILRADTIVQWNFNSPVPDANVNTGTMAPSVGSGTASSVGGISTSFPPGDGAHAPAGTSDNSGWQTSSYPSLTNNNKSAGVRFDIDTTGYENISIDWYQRHSATASRYCRLQYTLDGSTFIDSDPITISADSVFANK